MARKSTPFACLHWGRSPYSGLFEIGGFFAPWPADEQTPGAMIEALAHFHIVFERGRWPRFYGFSSDPARRPI